MIQLSNGTMISLASLRWISDALDVHPGAIVRREVVARRRWHLLPPGTRPIRETGPEPGFKHKLEGE